MAETKELVTIEAAELPPGARTEILPVDGAKLRTAYWLPTAMQPKGTVVLFSGRTEFIEKYGEVIGELIDRGFAVATLDWRGQGLSSRAQENYLKGHVGDFEEFDKDTEAFVKQIVLPNCPAPYFLLAHSMGGNIALRYLSQPDCIVERAILVAPMTGVHTKPIPHWAARAIASLGTTLGMGARFVPGGGDIDPGDETFDQNAVTSDHRRFERYKSYIGHEPKLALGAPTLGWLSAAFRTMKEMSSPERLRKIRCPVLILSAGADTIADSTTHEPVAKGIPQGRFLSVEGAKHEILMETDSIRAQFWEEFDRFVSVSTEQDQASPAA